MRSFLAVLLAFTFFGVFLAPSAGASSLPQQGESVLHSHALPNETSVLSGKNARDLGHALKACCDGAGCHSGQVNFSDATWLDASPVLLNPGLVVRLLGRVLQPLTGPPRDQAV